MSASEVIEKVAQSATSWLVVSLFGGIAWLVRLVFTNQKQIELLQQSIERDRADVKELKADMKELLRRSG